MNDEERGMYEFAYYLIRSAGFKLRQDRKYSVIKVREKTSQMDLVTEQDILIEKYLAEAIMRIYPGHGILAEEGRDWANADGNGYTWVIDPIDGTINFYRFGKDYAISLALYKEGNPVFGLVYDVAGEVMFAARHGDGAIMNGCRLDILPERQKKMNKAVVAMSSRTMIELAGMGMDVWGMLSGVQALRYLGCASLELCKVGNGEIDLFISSNVYEWDIAAGRIFLEQKGGFFFSKRKVHSSRFSKLMVIAFRSPQILEEALEFLPPSIRKAYC